jgi:hypothetical protein
MKATPVSVPSMFFVHGFDQGILVGRGKIIQEHFDELSIELLMP